ncbi:SurA N-terminal domain-containing protein [Streptomyces sp. NPDC057702]|uniref:SurA N-terminal domain-containing protein n=1 Tax=unclassified Streptomyces TaxID=2593676 RepID=UPI00368E6C97
MLRSLRSRRTVKSRRAALAVSTAAVLGATPLLTGCGSDAHPGAAAVIDGDRITVSQLQAQVRDVRDAQRASPQAEQLIKGSGRLSRDTLIRMIHTRVVERAAKDQGITVTRREVRQEIKLAESQSGGAKALRAALVQQGIAPQRIADTVRVDLLRNKLVRQLGEGPAVTELQATSKRLDIDVNPRYGAWDGQQGTAVLVQEPWIKMPEPAKRPV